MLLSAGAEPDALASARRITPLHLAVAEGRTALIEALLAGGATPNIAHAEFGTPLHVAAARNHCRCARVRMRAQSTCTSTYVRLRGSCCWPPTPTSMR